MINYSPVQWLQAVIKSCMQYIQLDQNSDKHQITNNCMQLHTIYSNFTEQERRFIHNLIHDQFESNDALLILHN